MFVLSCSYFWDILIKSENCGRSRPGPSMRNVFLTHDLMHCISGLDKASLRPSAIFTFDIKSCQFLFVNFASKMQLLLAGLGYQLVQGDDMPKKDG